MKGRFVDGMSNEEYHSSGNVGKSKLDLVAKSPLHYIEKIHGYSASFRLGSAFHTFILENEKFKDEYIIPPTWGKRSKADRALWEDYFISLGATGVTELPAAEWFNELQRQTSKSLITENDVETIHKMAEGIARNQLASELLTGCVAERSYFWKDTCGLTCQVRPDLYKPEDNIIVDLKTTDDAGEKEFAHTVFKYRYHVQAAMYSYGVNAVEHKWPDFYFVVVEKTAPYCCAVYKLHEDVMDNGHELMIRDLETLAECVKNNEYPGYENNLELYTRIEHVPFKVSLDGQEVSV